jgi:hypothetical protein
MPARPSCERRLKPRLHRSRRYRLRILLSCSSCVVFKCRRLEPDKKQSDWSEQAHEEKVFDAEHHVKDASEAYYEEIALEGDQFLRMDGALTPRTDAADGTRGEGATTFAIHRGQRIAYTVAGRRSGQPVFLQHGFLSNKEAYSDYVSALSAAGFLVLCADSLGHGQHHGTRFPTAQGMWRLCWTPRASRKRTSLDIRWGGGLVRGWQNTGPIGSFR